jgi:hypothetical protein
VQPIRDEVDQELLALAQETARVGAMMADAKTFDQLVANAEELRRMAHTATTADVARALLTLADRYAALAARRRTEQARSSRRQPARQRSSS